MAKEEGKPKASGETLVVKSKMKEYIKAQECNSAGGLAEALTPIIQRILDKAVERAQANGRKTVMDKDI